MASQTTSPAANAELVRAGFRAFNVGDAHGCMALAAPDLVTHPAQPAQLTTLVAVMRSISQPSQRVTGFAGNRGS